MGLPTRIVVSCVHCRHESVLTRCLEIHANGTWDVPPGYVRVTGIRWIEGQEVRLLAECAVCLGPHCMVCGAQRQDEADDERRRRLEAQSREELDEEHARAREERGLAREEDP